MPEAEYRIVADEYINNLVPLLGNIVFPASSWCAVSDAWIITIFASPLKAWKNPNASDETCRLI